MNQNFAPSSSQARAMFTPAAIDAVFHPVRYSSEHWALGAVRLDDPKVICVARCRGIDFGIYLNPTDSRGYRCIVRLIDNEHMEQTLNRDHSMEEHLALAEVAVLAEGAMRRVVPIVQTLKLGNNAHGFDQSSGKIQIGNAHEPDMLHLHLVGRGDPLAEYVPGVKLGGPPAGVIFDIGGKGAGQAGQTLLPWKLEDLAAVASRFRRELAEIHCDACNITVTAAR